MKNDTHPYRRYRFKKSCRGNWYWQYHSEQWIDVYKICGGVRWPSSQIPPIIGFMLDGGLVHAKRLNGAAEYYRESFEAKGSTFCGRKGNCRRCFALDKPGGELCSHCFVAIEMVMDPVENRRREAIRRQINDEKRKEKQERRRARKLELANANYQ